MGSNCITQSKARGLICFPSMARRPLAITMIINGQPLVATQSYRLVTNNFLAGGGDSFVAFKSGKGKLTVGSDLDALETYVKANSPLAGTNKGRIKRVD